MRRPCVPSGQSSAGPTSPGGTGPAGDWAVAGNHAFIGGERPRAPGLYEGPRRWRRSSDGGGDLGRHGSNVVVLHALITSQPAAARRSSVSASRWRLRSILSGKYKSLTWWWSRPCDGQPCQPHPSRTRRRGPRQQQCLPAFTRRWRVTHRCERLAPGLGDGPEGSGGQLSRSRKTWSGGSSAPGGSILTCAPSERPRMGAGSAGVSDCSMGASQPASPSTRPRECAVGADSSSERVDHRRARAPQPE